MGNALESAAELAHEATDTEAAFKAKQEVARKQAEDDAAKIDQLQSRLQQALDQLAQLQQTNEAKAVEAEEARNATAAEEARKANEAEEARKAEKDAARKRADEHAAKNDQLQFQLQEAFDQLAQLQRQLQQAEEARKAAEAELACKDVDLMSLNKTETISMSQGHSVEMSHDLFSQTDQCFVGLGWDAAGGIDVDASIILFDGEKNWIETIYFGNKTYGTDAICHQGDNRSGGSNADDERIDINLDKVAAIQVVHEIYVVVNVYTDGKAFSDVNSAYVRVCTLHDGIEQELCRYTLDAQVQTNGLIFARIKRSAYKENTWILTALGREAQGRRAKDEQMRAACLYLDENEKGTQGHFRLLLIFLF